MEVSTLDFGDDDAPTDFVRMLRETGFAVLARPPIETGFVRAIRAEWLGFLATEAKHAYRSPPGGQAGYFPPPPDGDDRDLKEFFHVRPGGVYPAEVSSAALQYFDAARALGRTLLGWIDDAEPPPPGRPALAEMIDRSEGSVLRIQHYLPMAAGAPRSLRARAHADINLLTLLPAPREPGLQVQDTSGDWHDVDAAEDTMIVNAGEMLELATEGRFVATPHRVVNPPPDDGGSRVSLPLFLHPRSDVVLDGERSASAYLAERIATMNATGWSITPGGR